MNVVVLQGTVSSEPAIRTLPSGSTVLTLELSTVGADGTTGSVPVAWYDPPTNTTFEYGQQITVLGEVRRRFFRTGGSTHSRTEVVTTRITSGNSPALVALLAAVQAVEL